jgi:hypothetical protein
MTGTINGVAKAYSFPMKFEEQAVGHSYLPRLWAMRRIAHLTDVAQSNGDNKEVVDEIIALSKKYGIISNYTSFLVTDPSESHRLPQPTPTAMPVPASVHGALRQSASRSSARLQNLAATSAGPAMARGFSGGGGSAGGSSGSGMSFDSAEAFDSVSTGLGGAALPSVSAGRMVSKAKASWAGNVRELQITDNRPVVQDFRAVPPSAGAPHYSAYTMKPQAESGKEAVMYAKKLNTLKDSVALDEEKGRRDLNDIKSMDDKTFYLRGGYWVDGAYDSSKSPKAKEITFGSKEYFELLKNNPGISKYLSVGRQVILMYKGQSYKISFKQEA